MINICCRFVRGKAIDLELDESLPIAVVRAELSERTGIDPDYLEIIHNGQPVPEDEDLSIYRGENRLYFIVHNKDPNIPALQKASFENNPELTYPEPPLIAEELKSPPEEHQKDHNHDQPHHHLEPPPPHLIHRDIDIHHQDYQEDITDFHHNRSYHNASDQEEDIFEDHKSYTHDQHELRNQAKEAFSTYTSAQKQDIKDLVKELHMPAHEVIQFYEACGHDKALTLGVIC